MRGPGSVDRNEDNVSPTSNRDTVEWLATLDDVPLARSAVDRFKNAAFDLSVEGESYRGKLKPKLRDDDPPPAAPVSNPSTHRAPQALAQASFVKRWSGAESFLRRADFSVRGAEPHEKRTWARRLMGRSTCPIETGS
jgi:hypothetical protein